MIAVADTSAWYAFIVPSDRFHDSSQAFIAQKPRLLTTSYVIEETLALLFHRAGKGISIKGLALFNTLPSADVVYVDKGMNAAIGDVFKTTPAFIDFVDASIIWLSRKIDIPVFTFDAHFKKMKVKTLP